MKTVSIPKGVSGFQNKNSSGYAAVGRTTYTQDSNSREMEEEEVKLVWEAKTADRTDPTPQLQSLSTEESVPGAAALLKIVRSTIKPKKSKFTCKFCSRTFISTNNLNKHTEIYHKSGAPRRIPRDNTYMCLFCAEQYKNEKCLIKHSK